MVSIQCAASNLPVLLPHAGRDSETWLMGLLGSRPELGEDALDLQLLFTWGAAAWCTVTEPVLGYESEAMHGSFTAGGGKVVAVEAPDFTRAVWSRE